MIFYKFVWGFKHLNKKKYFRGDKTVKSKIKFLNKCSLCLLSTKQLVLVFALFWWWTLYCVFFFVWLLLQENCHCYKKTLRHRDARVIISWIIKGWCKIGEKSGEISQAEFFLKTNFVSTDTEKTSKKKKKKLPQIKESLGISAYVHICVCFSFFFCKLFNQSRDQNDSTGTVRQ